MKAKDKSIWNWVVSHVRLNFKWKDPHNTFQNEDKDTLNDWWQSLKKHGFFGIKFKWRF